MTAESWIALVSGILTIGMVYGTTKSQTKTLTDGHASLSRKVDQLESKVDKCVTKSDFPAQFAYHERHVSKHDGEE